MKLLLLLAALPLAAQITLSIAAQQSPFPLRGINLYEAQACTAGPERAISAGQIRNTAVGAGIGFQDPALNTSILTTASSKTPLSRAVEITKWLSAGMSVSGGVVSYLKTQSTSNAKTWAVISVGTGALSAGLGILQPFIQADANTQAVSITTGVQAALVSDMTAIYAIPAGGCARTLMFFGTGTTKAIAEVLP